MVFGSGTRFSYKDAPLSQFCIAGSEGAQVMMLYPPQLRFAVTQYEDGSISAPFFVVEAARVLYSVRRSIRAARKLARLVALLKRLIHTSLYPQLLSYFP